MPFLQNGCSVGLTLPHSLNPSPSKLTVLTWSYFRALPFQGASIEVYVRLFAHIRPEYAPDTPSLRFQGRLAREGRQAVSLCVITKMFLSSSCITAQELKSLFEKKSLKEKPPSSGKQSILSVRLEQCPLQLNNPFNEYSKFDGKVSKNKTLSP